MSSIKHDPKKSNWGRLDYFFSSRCIIFFATTKIMKARITKLSNSAENDPIATLAGPISQIASFSAAVEISGEIRGINTSFTIEFTSAVLALPMTNATAKEKILYSLRNFANSLNIPSKYITQKLAGTTNTQSFQISG